MAVKIYTLGRFAVERDGQPVPLAGGAQRKPLALLKALIAFGGKEVSESRLADTLWPEAEGDLALRSFHTALYRLRKLLGTRQTVRLGSGSLTLDERLCWVDAREMERLLAEAKPTGDEARSRELAARAIGLYAGPFLPEEVDAPWALECRERLRRRFIECVEDLGEGLERAGDQERAAGLYTRAIEAEPLVEAAYRRLMGCHASLGRRADGLAVYERCRAALAAAYGVEPSAETQALRQSLQASPAQTEAVAEPSLSRQPPAKQPTEPASVERMAFPLPDKPSIAVLPFANLSDDPQQEHFADGMTDDLTTDLSKISALFVIGRNSVIEYKGKPVKPRQVAEELGVQYVLEGSVRRAGDRLRINAQLIDTLTGGHLWAERYGGKVEDVFALQDRINRKIVSALAIKLTPAEEREVYRKETDNVVARDAYVKGWDHYKRGTSEDAVKAAFYLEKAVELDPNYGKAYAALALLYSLGTSLGWYKGMNVSYFECAKRTDRYLELARTNPSLKYHSALAYRYELWRLYEKAVAEEARQVQLDPNYPDALVGLSHRLMNAGRPSEAMEYAKRAIRRDPRWTYWARWSFLMGHFCLEQYAKAAEVGEELLALEPELAWLVHLLLVPTYAHLGREDQARASLEQLREALGGWPRDLRALSATSQTGDQDCRSRVYEGWLKAGLPGEPDGYYKFFEEDRLNNKEIRELVSGRTLTGGEHWGDSWQIRCAENGEFTSGKERGKWWIEDADDLLCIQWDERYENYAFRGTVFRNPDWTGGNDQYLKVNQTSTSLFAVED